MSLIGQIYVAIFAASGIVSLAAIAQARQFEDPDVRRGLVWLLATTGGWALSKSAFLMLPAPFREPVYIVGLALGFGTVWAWLYFCSAYTGQRYHRNRSLRRLGAVVFSGVVLVKVTNPLHGAYFSTTEVSTPFVHLAIDHNVLHWTATGLSYMLAGIGLFMIFQFYLNSGYETRSLSALTGLLALPVILDIAAEFTPWLIDVIYAPLGVAAFALGVLFVFDRRFLAVQRSERGRNLSIFLDENDRIRDATTAIMEVFPELEGATGEALEAVVPSVADTLEEDDQILERGGPDDRRYYFVSSSTMTVGDRGARVVQLSDVTRTERQRRELIERERELDEQNELYRAIIDASFAFVLRSDTDGEFTFVSPAVEEFLGYVPAELEGQPISVTHPDEAATERAWDAMEPVLNGESNRVRDFPLQTKAGMTVYADIRGVPVYDGSVPPEDRTPEDIVEVQLMVRDATERRQREGLISVINRVLRHNLRNKMTVITNYAKLLETDLEGDKAAKAEQIRETGMRLVDLGETARDIENNRDPSPDLEPTDIAPILHRTVSQIRDRYPAADVTVDAPSTFVADTHERLETALWEIVDNATKHGGDPPSVEIDVTVEERRIAVAVTDNGPGLPENERKVLNSNTETPLVHGKGLGLWLAYWIVTSLDGEIDATTSSEGTTITLWLPSHEEE